MNKIISSLQIVVAGIFLMTVFSACTMVLPGSSERYTPAPDSPVSGTPDKMGQNLVRAIVKNDPEAFLKELPQNLIQNFGKKDFEQTRASMVKELGTPVSYTYLRNMAHPVATISLWVIRFERRPTAAADKENNKPQVMEVLFRAAYAPIDGKNTLLSFNFY